MIKEDNRRELKRKIGEGRQEDRKGKEREGKEEA